MNRTVGLISLCALAVGCSDHNGNRPTSAPRSEEGLRSASIKTAPSALAPSRAGGLTADVSALSGDRSDLNIRVTELGTVVDLPSDALFEYGKATLTPVAETELAKAAELMRRSPAGAIQVVGHTDSHGESAYNQALSEARAKTVADWFGRQVGVRQRVFAVSGRGEAAPIAANEKPDGTDDPSARAKNRRVEVILPKS